MYVEASTWWKPKKTNHLCVNSGELPTLEKMVWEALKVVINIENACTQWIILNPHGIMYEKGVNIV